MVCTGVVRPSEGTGERVQAPNVRGLEPSPGLKQGSLSAARHRT